MDHGLIPCIDAKNILQQQNKKQVITGETIINVPRRWQFDWAY